LKHLDETIVFTAFASVNGTSEGPFGTVGQNEVRAYRGSHQRIISESNKDSATIILEADVELSPDL